MELSCADSRCICVCSSVHWSSLRHINMGLAGWLTAKVAISVFGVTNAMIGTVCLFNPATIAAAPVFFAAAEASIIEVVNPVGPVTTAITVATGPL
ncbi:hypothetical protein FVE85_8700 [Porphyridium purpureum]|uniref:Uncharacterized protein n=1 Tax=Porphyridium purpureum TaxID=35688 RepID=A0A5J4YPX8_PORPP|nr:hypothetical protein FVE85_8700 [Porphyridium purpureum]|eukprot:POR4228..scf296_7